MTVPLNSSIVLVTVSAANRRSINSWAESLVIMSECFGNTGSYDIRFASMLNEDLCITNRRWVSTKARSDVLIHVGLCLTALSYIGLLIPDRIKRHIC